MTDANANNPRKLQTAIRLFQAGVLGHVFSRPLTPAEKDRLVQIIETNSHGSCLFLNAETGLAIGGWICCCEKECQTPLVIFCADCKISITAQAAGEKNFVFTGADTVQIETQSIGVHDQARFLQTASVASQVAAQIAGEVGAKVAAKIAQEVANLTVAETLGSAGDHAAKSAAEPRLTFSFESGKPN